jgi:FMN phosphatase YigB (HAD superfamily)
LDTYFFEGFNLDLRSEGLWREFCHIRGKQVRIDAAHSLPPLPDIDGERLFWEMMRMARNPDPSMYPALKKLKASGKFLVAALSNTVVFPEDHAYSRGIADEIRSQFDVFISSAHIGLRKPDPQIYLYAVRKMDAYAREKARVGGLSMKESGWGSGITAGDVIFLDDIGANLKTGKKVGMRTIKVQLGKVADAVKELENVTGLRLLGEENSKSRL